MTTKEELIYANEEIRLLKGELECYAICIGLMIEQITGVCDGKITIEQLRVFRNNMDGSGGQVQ